MKKLFITLVITSLSLSACSGGGGTTAAVCKQQYWDGILGVCLPDGWKVVDHETLQARGVPEEVVTAFQSSQVVSGQNPTVTVTKETLQSDVKPEDYSAASIRAVSSLPAYKVIDSRVVTVDTHKLSLHVFSAQPLAEEPERRFYQISSSADGAGYTLTALTPLSVNSTVESQVLAIMQSLTFTDPATKVAE